MALSAELRQAAPPNVSSTAQRIAECGAQGLAVPRCSVWLFDATHARLECLDLFDARSGLHATSGALVSATFPAYVRALKTERTIAADDVMADPRTRELQHYFEGQGISSMLDAAIVIGGRTVGVVCHESFEVRRWDQDDLVYACRMAEHLALVLEQAARP